MKFSVVIPLYNKAPYVRKALETVCAQTYHDYEIIVINDGSTDNSAIVAEEYLRSISGVHYMIINQQNAGVSAARNNGVAQASGEYIAFLDADDWWEPTYLERMAQLIEDYPEAGLYGMNYIYYKPGKTRVALKCKTGYINYPKEYYEGSAMMIFTSSSSSMPKRVFEEMGGFPLGIKLGEDFLLWAKTAMHYPVAFCEEPLAYYNNDVPVNLRATRNLHHPEHHMLFRLEAYLQLLPKGKSVLASPKSSHEAAYPKSFPKGKDLYEPTPKSSSEAAYPKSFPEGKDLCGPTPNPSLEVGVYNSFARVFGVHTADPMQYDLLKENAVKNRSNPTEAESVMWDMLKGNKIGYHFRRQHIILDYIVDFICLEKGLIIELDGGYHNDPQQKEYDQARTAHLQRLGYTELRFKNEELLCNPDAVIHKITDTLQTLPSLQGRAEGAGIGSDWKRLIDKLRVSGLLEYWISEEYHDQAAEELTKVDWSQQPKSVIRIYKTPIWMLKAKRQVMKWGSAVKQSIINRIVRRI